MRSGCGVSHLRTVSTMTPKTSPFKYRREGLALLNCAGPTVPVDIHQEGCHDGQMESVWPNDPLHRHPPLVGDWWN